MNPQAQEHPLFVADWLRATFIHHRVDAAVLQPFVPFKLDLHNGDAMVSLVAFTMRGMRLRRSGALGAWLCRPIATHQFFNVRTYVRCGDEGGIMFLAEWLNNALSVRLGPWPYGLPYRLGRLAYNRGTVDVVDARGGAAFRCRTEMETEAAYNTCREGSLDAFLLERYAAFTFRAGVRRRFRVAHAPWEQVPVRVEIADDRLLREAFPWFANATLIGAHHSPGVTDVGMGAPRRVAGSPCWAGLLQEDGDVCAAALHVGRACD